MTPPPIEFAFLADREQSAEGTASILADFIAGATSTLEIAIYDLLPSGPPAPIMLGAVRPARTAGGATRVGVTQGPGGNPCIPAAARTVVSFVA